MPDSVVLTLDLSCRMSWLRPSLLGTRLLRTAATTQRNLPSPASSNVTVKKTLAHASGSTSFCGLFQSAMRCFHSCVNNTGSLTLLGNGMKADIHATTVRHKTFYRMNKSSGKRYNPRSLYHGTDPYLVRKSAQVKPSLVKAQAMHGLEKRLSTINGRKIMWRRLLRNRKVCRY